MQYKLLTSHQYQKPYNNQNTPTFNNNTKKKSSSIKHQHLKIMLKTSHFIPSHSKTQRITFFGTIYEIFIVQQKQQTFFFLSDLAPPIARSFLLL